MDASVAAAAALFASHPAIILFVLLALTCAALFAAGWSWAWAGMMLSGVALTILCRRNAAGVGTVPEQESKSAIDSFEGGHTETETKARITMQMSPFDRAMRLGVILASALACAAVIAYFWAAIWVGQVPNFGVHVPWKGTLKPVAPAAYPLVLMAVWLWIERAAAHRNPGYGFLWYADFIPSLAVFGWLVLTGVRAFVGELSLDEPTALVTWLAFIGASTATVFFNARHWFGVERSEQANASGQATHAGPIHIDRVENMIVADPAQRIVLHGGTPPTLVKAA